jgi:hypothetical protein
VQISFLFFLYDVHFIYLLLVYYQYLIVYLFIQVVDKSISNGLYTQRDMTCLQLLYNSNNFLKSTIGYVGSTCMKTDLMVNLKKKKKLLKLYKSCVKFEAIKISHAIYIYKTQVWSFIT